MKLGKKTTIMTLISAVTISLGTSPAFAETHSSYSMNSASGSVTQQNLVATDIELMTSPLDALADATQADPRQATHGYNVEAAIAKAKSEVGTSRPTGWSQPGECIMSAKRWLVAGGAQWTGSGDPVSNYKNAKRVPLAAAAPGDVIQYEFLASPSSWATGVHTVLVVGKNEDGTLRIIESNNPGGSGLVSENDSWLPEPPAGFAAAVWRF